MDAVAYPSPVGGRQGEPERTHSNGGFRKNEVFPFLLMGSDTFYADIRYSVNMEVPVYYCIGNHDLVKGKYGEELFESIYGPVYYSFDAGNTHYIVTPMWVGDYRPGYTKEDVYHWLKNDLAQILKENRLLCSATTTGPAATVMCFLPARVWILTSMHII